MILNELSMQGSTNEIEEINNIISEFVLLCHKISKEKGDQNFYYTDDIFSNEITSGYKIYDWLQNPSIPQNEKAFFRKMINRKQLIDTDEFLGSEFLVHMDNGKRVSAVGCLMAYEAEEYVVSLCTAPLWRSKDITGSYITIEEELEAYVKNCSTSEDVERLVEENRKKTMRMVSSGQELWEKRESIYPHLVFCNCVKKQLEEARNSLHIKIIMKRLQILEDYFQTYEGSFDKDILGHRCRDESESVENNSNYFNMRVFEMPNGKKEFFKWHISFSGNFPGRIHFLPEPQNKVGIIGYVGKHLPTSKFPTI